MCLYSTCLGDLFTNGCFCRTTEAVEAGVVLAVRAGTRTRTGVARVLGVETRVLGVQTKALGVQTKAGATRAHGETR